MRALCYGLLCIFFLQGCVKKEEIALPPDEVLIELLFDLHLAEASMTRVHANDQDSIALLLRDIVATSHGITPELMESWLTTLQRSPERLGVIYDSLIVRFEQASVIE